VAQASDALGTGVGIGGSRAGRLLDLAEELFQVAALDIVGQAQHEPADAQEPWDIGR
jgi:hypothetical protein